MREDKIQPRYFDSKDQNKKEYPDRLIFIESPLPKRNAMCSAARDSRYLPIMIMEKKEIPRWIEESQMDSNYRIDIPTVMRIFLVTLFYLGCIWISALIFVDLSSLFRLPLLQGSKDFVDFRYVPSVFIILVLSFAAGRSWERPFPGKYSLLAFVFCESLCCLSMPSYFLADLGDNKHISDFIYYAKFLSSFALPMLFGSILNLFGFWKLSFMTEDMSSVFMRLIEENGGDHLARVLYIIGSTSLSILIFWIFQHLYENPAGIISAGKAIFYSF